MEEQRDNVPNDEFSRLNDIIREFAAYHEESASWPDPDDILAYLRGNANRRQQKRVLRALADSAPFRRALVAIEEGTEMTASSEYQQEYDRQFVPRLDAVKDVIKTLPEKLHSRGGWLNELMAFVFAARPALALNAVAIAMTGILIWGIAPVPGRVAPTGLHPAAALSPAYFAAGPSRGPGRFKDAENAAKARFAESISFNYHDNVYSCSATGASEAGIRPNQVFELGIETPGYISRITLRFDERISPDDSVTIWVLGIPDLHLYQMPYWLFRTVVPWQSLSIERGAICLTAKTPYGYIASDVYCLGL